MSAGHLEAVALRGRLLPIEGLRGIAVMGVILLHLRPRYCFWMWSFVDLFFVISGLVITRLLLDAPALGKMELRNFWIRRALRIWPVYFFTLLAVLGLGVVLRNLGTLDAGTGAGVWRYFLFLQFTELYRPGAVEIDAFHLPMFIHSWSLAVEEQFYLLWPLVVAIFRRRCGLLAVICLLVLAGGVASRAQGLVPMVLVSRVDGLALGSLIACTLAWRPIVPGSRSASIAPVLAFVMIATGAALALPYVLLGYSMRNATYMVQGVSLTVPVLGFSLLFAGIVSLTLAAPGGIVARLTALPVFTYLGSISYAMYMFHVPLIMLYGSALALSGSEKSPLLDLAYLAVVIALAHLSRRYLEEPFNRQKHRFPLDGLPVPGRESEATTSAGAGRHV